MQELRYQTAGLRAAAGTMQTLTGSLDVGGFDVGYEHYEVPDKIRYSLTLTSVGDAIVLGGQAQATIKGACARCLEEAFERIVSDIEGYLVLDPQADVTGMQEDEYEVVPDDGIVDLAPYVLAAVIVEIPPIFLCKEDCRGLCPRCGCNRNAESCDCDDQIDDSNPFSVLKGFFDADSDDSD